MENGGIPIATKRQCVASITKYCEFTEMSPDELIADYAKQMRETGRTTKHNDLLDRFWEDYPTKTTAAVYFACLKGFYRHNDCPLTTSAPTVPIVRKKDFKLETIHVRAICDNAILPHKSWILANNYMGLRVNAITQLAVSNFMTENWVEDEPLYPVFIPRMFSGTFDYTTFIGNDAMQVLRIYFESQTFSRQSRPWSYSTVGLNSALKKYALRAKIITAPHGTWKNDIPKGYCPLHSHCFRKRVQTVLEKNDVPLNWVDRLLGHVPRGADASAYSIPSVEELHDAYLYALAELEVYGHHPDTPTKANVELQKYRAIEEIRKYARQKGLDATEMDAIINPLKLARTETEINETLENVLVTVRKIK